MAGYGVEQARCYDPPRDPTRLPKSIAPLLTPGEVAERLKASPR
jgi:hypothetical protein